MMRKLAYILIFIFAICNLYTQQEIDTLAQKKSSWRKIGYQKSRRGRVLALFSKRETHKGKVLN